MNQPLADNYHFWTPIAEHLVTVGPEQLQVAMPQIPLPIKNELTKSDTPSDDTIGVSIYDYLRQFPECPHNRAYAEILREAYPHFLADLGSQIVMLDHKDIEAPYLKRKIVSMQILLLLDQHNSSLLQQLGINFYELGLMYPELPRCRSHFVKAMQYLAAAREDAATLNYLARIDYLLGDFPRAIERWQRLLPMLDDIVTKQAIAVQIQTLKDQGEPEKSLLDDLEAIGEAMELMASDNIVAAKMIFEKLEEENIIPEQFPNPEFYYMLGICRERTGDSAGAFGSYVMALQVDPEHELSRQGQDRISGGNC